MFCECVTPRALPATCLLILLWAFQAGQSSTVIENIHTIIAAAAVKFSFDQLTHLFILIQKVSTDVPEVNRPPPECFVSRCMVLTMRSLHV